jgi:hypothetical protein
MKLLRTGFFVIACAIVLLVDAASMATFHFHGLAGGTLETKVVETADRVGIGLEGAAPWNYLTTRFLAGLTGVHLVLIFAFWRLKKKYVHQGR